MDWQIDMRKLVVALHVFVVYLRSCAILNMQSLQIVVLQMNCKTAVPTAVNKVSEKIK
jgi:hypothetical protein